MHYTLRIHMNNLSPEFLSISPYVISLKQWFMHMPMGTVYTGELFICEGSVSGILVDKKNPWVIKPAHFAHLPIEPHWNYAPVGSRGLSEAC